MRAVIRCDLSVVAQSSRGDRGTNGVPGRVMQNRNDSVQRGATRVSTMSSRAMAHRSCYLTEHPRRSHTNMTHDHVTLHQIGGSTAAIPLISRPSDRASGGSNAVGRQDKLTPRVLTSLDKCRAPVILCVSD
jgi:hypothetical protein